MKAHLSPHLNLLILSLVSNPLPKLLPIMLVKTLFPKVQKVLQQETEEEDEVMKLSCFEHFKDLAFKVGNPPPNSIRVGVEVDDLGSATI